MALIALKIDVDTLRGTREGLPRLLKALDRARARATILFSLGPDHTGWALRRIFRPGFLSKVSRTSVLSHYGLRTLLYGVLLPAPDIGRVAAGTMRASLAAGHEGGIHAWDHVLWQDNVRDRDETWTRRQMERAYTRYAEIFGRDPATHGAAGWQMNPAAFRQIDDWGMQHASDGRGRRPYVAVVEGRACRHVQYPTTLPTFDEVLGRDGVDETALARHLLELTDGDLDQVFTLHAELEGGLLIDAFEALLAGWLAQGHRLVGLDELHAATKRELLPLENLRWGDVPGRSGELVVAS